MLSPLTGRPWRGAAHRRADRLVAVAVVWRGAPQPAGLYPGRCRPGLSHAHFPPGGRLCLAARRLVQVRGHLSGLAVMLGFAQAEIITGGRDFWGHLGLYLAAGARLWLPVCVTQFGMLAAAWALGCLRLQGGGVRRAWVIYPLVLAALLALGLLFPQVQPYLGWLALPVRLPVLAGAGLGAYLPGLTLRWPGPRWRAGVAWPRGASTSRAPRRRPRPPPRWPPPPCWATARWSSPSAQAAPAQRGALHAAGCAGRGCADLERRAARAAPAERGVGFGSVVFFLLTWARPSRRIGARAPWRCSSGWCASTSACPELRADLNLWPVFQSLPLRARPRLLGKMTPSPLALGVGWLGLLATASPAFPPPAGGRRAAALAVWPRPTPPPMTSYARPSRSPAGRRRARAGLYRVFLGGLALVALVGLWPSSRAAPLTRCLPCWRACWRLTGSSPWPSTVSRQLGR